MAFLPAIAAVASVAGSVMSAVGAMQQSRAQAASAEYNAKVSDEQAKAARDAAAVEAEDRRRAGMDQRASAIAARGASGIALAGTPLLVDEDILGRIELDAARTRHAGEAKAVQNENQARLDRFTASNYRAAGPLSAGASLLGGISKVRY